MKIFLKWTGITLLVLLILIIAAPFLFKDKIVALVKEEANKNLNAKIDFGKFDLSLLRSFPDFSLSIENLSIINLEPFAGDTLIYAKKTDITVDIMSVIKGNEMGIKSVELLQPVMNFLVLKDARANWDIAKASDSSGESSGQSAFKIKLKHYAIHEGRIVYNDESLGFYLGMEGLEHKGSGDFTSELFDLNTQTDIASTKMVYDGIPYLSRVKSGITSKLNMDMKNFRFTFSESNVKLNNLDIAVAGWVAMPDTNIDMDLSFSSDKSDFKNFISLIPVIYSKDFESLKASGILALGGFIKGRYNAGSMPGFGMNLKIDNGMFQYPSLPASVEKVKLDLSVNNPDGIPDHTITDLKQLHVELAGDPFDAKLLLKTPISDPDIDAAVKGKIDLGSIQKFVPLESGTKLSGVLTADLKAKGRMSSIEQKKYDQFNAEGGLVLKGMEYSSASMKGPFSIEILDMSFNPRNVNLNAFAAKTLSSDFKAKGSLENFLAYALKDETLKGSLSLESNKIDLDEWMSDEGTGSSTQADSTAAGVLDVPGNIDFTMSANIGTLKYDDMNMFNVKGSLIVRDRTINMQNLNLQMMDGSVSVSGLYSSADLKKPLFSMDLAIKEFDIQKTVNTFNTVEKLAPIARSCSGKFSAALSVKGDLDQAMTPVEKSINGAGKLNTSSVTVQNFNVFNKVADVLKMPSWKSLVIPSVNPSFKIINGRVYVDPTEVSINGMKGVVAGSNGFDQSIDYTMAMQIPRASFGGAANSVLNNLVSQANAKGANMSLGDNVPVNLVIGGTVTDPKVSTDLGKQGANAMADLKEKAKEEFDKKKDEAEARAREEAEKLKAEAASRIEAEKAKASAEADKLKKEAEAKAKATADSIKKAAEKEAEKKAKETLKNFNPLKK